MPISTLTRPNIVVLERGHEIIDLRREGKSFRQIATESGISKSAVHRRYDAAMAEPPPVKATYQPELSCLSASNW